MSDFCDHAAVIRHESAHAGMLAAHGIVPVAIDVTGWGQYRGVVTKPASFVGRNDRAALLIEAKTIIAAWLAECGRPRPVAAW